SLAVGPRTSLELLQSQVAELAVVVAAQVEFVGGTAIAVGRGCADLDDLIDRTVGHLHLPGAADRLDHPSGAGRAVGGGLLQLAEPATSDLKTAGLAGEQQQEILPKRRGE